METFEFTIHLDRQPTEYEIDRLFEVGFDDSLPEVGNGRGMIHLARRAETLGVAIVSAIDDAHAAGFNVTSIEDEDLVSLRTIAHRIGRSTEYVRLLAIGQRGPGSFPPPVSGDGWQLFSWTDVTAWVKANLGIDIPEDDRSRTLALANHLLHARNLSRESDKEMIHALAVA